MDLLERECRIQAWVSEHGYSAPRLLELIPPGELFESPVQVMQRVAGTRMDEAGAATPSLIPGLLGRAAGTQAALHRLPAPDWARGPEWAMGDQRLLLTRWVVERDPHGPVADALARTERIVPLLAVPDPVICHGDFHTRNLLVDGDTVWVIDWTDAGVGDRHGDIARSDWLLRYGSVLTGGTVHPADFAIADQYLESYRRELPIDEGRLRLWLPLQNLHAWAMEVAGQMGLLGPGDPDRDPRIAAWAKEQFWQSIEGLP